MNGSKVLVRSRSDRMVAGVCAGLANYFNVDVTLVRVLVAAIAIVTGGAGGLGPHSRRGQAGTESRGHGQR
jgi:phage shock protein C